MTDGRDLAAKKDLLEALTEFEIDENHGWSVFAEQELTTHNLFVSKLVFIGMDSWPPIAQYATIEASGYRIGGGYEYLLTIHGGEGGRIRGPLSFSYPGQAIQWARRYVLNI